MHPRTGGPGYETRWKLQIYAPFPLRALHLAAVVFVIHPGQMQDSVQHQDADLIEAIVAKLQSLGLGPFRRNDEVAQIASAAVGWKRQNVCCVIVTQKGTV